MNVELASVAAIETCDVCQGTECHPRVYGCLSKCAACGHIFYPEPFRLRPADLYSEVYFQTAEYLDYASQQRTIAKNSRAYLRLMRHYGARGGRLLEVGCAYGFFLNEARHAFDVEGIDVSVTAVASGRQAFGLAIHEGEFLDLPETSRFDVVCMWDTIEHLPSPSAYLAKAARLVKDDGWLFFTTGDIGSVTARIQGRRWRLIHPPTHLHYFSKSTATYLLNRHGFHVIGIRNVGAYRNVRNMLHGLALFSKSGWVRTVARRVLAGAPDAFGHHDVYMNLFDIMFVAARKGIAGIAPS